MKRIRIVVGILLVAGAIAAVWFWQHRSQADPSEVKNLLSAADYEKFVAAEAGH